MISDKMKKMVEGSSAIRQMFEEGNRLSAIYGKENVFDFSLGNPNLPPPEKVKEAIKEILDTTDACELHGYTNSNSGYADVREKVADSLNQRFDLSLSGKNIIMTCGAAGGLNVILKTLLNPGDEVIVFAPYFGEYRSYINNYDGVIVEVPCHRENFLPDVSAMKESITGKTRAVILNNPNNPSGVVYGEEVIKEISDVLREKSREYDAPVYLISDEPYREIVYNGKTVPYVTKYYENAMVVYSYSKSLSLPGERIGYLVIPDSAGDSRMILDAANVANRILGFVNAPTLQQKVIGMCLTEETDISYYQRNRDTLIEGLDELGFEYVMPEGAFYLFLKSPEEDEKEFCRKAKKYNLLMVPGSAFSCPGYVRLAYCVSYETITGSFKAFSKLAEEYFV